MFSASSETRDRNAPTNATQIRLQTSGIRQQHRPIRSQLPARLSFRQGQRGEMLSAALAYSNAAFGGAICIVMLNILANAVRGTGNMTLPGFVIMGSVIAHILISPPLIFGWGPIPALGPAGAGLGLMTP